MVLIEPPAPPPGVEDNILRVAGRFLRKHEMWLIRLQAIKDGYPDPEAYEKAEHLKGPREFLKASTIILELLRFIATIQTERLAELLGQMPVTKMEPDEKKTTEQE